LFELDSQKHKVLSPLDDKILNYLWMIFTCAAFVKPSFLNSIYQTSLDLKDKTHNILAIFNQ